MMHDIDWDTLREIDDRKYRNSYNYDGRYEDGEDEEDDDGEDGDGEIIDE